MLENGLKEDQVLCGEHADIGAITLLIQDHVGGLEVHLRARLRFYRLFDLRGQSADLSVSGRFGTEIWHGGTRPKKI